MLMHLAAPRPFMVVSMPYSTSSSITKSTISTRGGIGSSLIEIGRNKPNFPATEKPNQPEKIADNIFRGMLLQGGLVFQQNFLIRLSELGHDAKASIGALIHILQDSALNHCKSAGIRMENFCSTPEMSRRNLMWVVYRMQIAVDCYPSWADDIQVDTWICASGKNGMRREWIVRDFKTGETLLRAVCVYVMMNKKTRKLSKFIEEIREEMQGIFMDITDPIIGDEYGKKLRELDADTADIVRTGLVPTWSDLDFNQHVNHVKYINWILESAPHSIVETHKLSAMTLEFWKECGMNSCLQSLSALATKDELPHRSTQNHNGVELELDHTIRLENQPQILLKGRTVWLPKTS